MSIGNLGSAGDQFRDFLGGGQRDIGQGLQAVLSNYSNPNGNFVRLNDRSQGMFQQTSSEYQSTFDQDAQNSYSQTWYAEYRAVLLLRAEALKKKLNRSYAGLLENSIYAPMLPDTEWAPQANRDMNDIDAADPLQFFSGGTVKNPPPPTDAEIDPTDYLHPEWFSGSDKYSGGSGNAYDDIRRYINYKYLNPVGGSEEIFKFGDTDGDGQVITYDHGGSYKEPSAYDSSYNTNESGDAQYYDLWNMSGPGAPQIYGLDAAGVGGSRYTEIAKQMNIPPSTTTQNFVAQGNPNSTYYIEIPAGTSKTLTAAQIKLLPSYVQAQDPDFNGIFTTKQRDDLINAGGTKSLALSDFVADGANWVLAGGTKFYDPRNIPSQNMFDSSGYGDPPGGPITNIDMNDLLVGPAGGSLPEQDVSTSNAGIPVYQQGFVDSWREARQLQKREAQIEAAYQAYLDGQAKNSALPPDDQLSYEEMMDQVFAAVDQIGGSGGPLPPGGGAPPAVPPGTTSGGNLMDNIMPYGYYIMPGDPPTLKGAPGERDINPLYDVGSAYDAANPGEMDGGSIYKLIYDRLAMAADPTSIPGGDSGTKGLNDDLPQTTGSTSYPAPAGTEYVTGTNGSKLYNPVPIGAGEIGEDGDPTTGDGQPNINDGAGVKDLNDTLNEGQALTMEQISKLFVGRQWDYSPGYTGNGLATAGSEDVAPVKYEAETISSHLMVLPGWWYDGSASLDNVGKALVTLQPAIDGLAWQTAANSYGLGKLDDYVNSLMGGPFFHVGGGSDSLGLGPDLDGSSVKYSIGVGFGMGIGGIYWGHTSAVGTVYKIEELMKNSGGGFGSDPGPAFDVMKASLSILAGLGGASVDDMSLFPNVGIAGFHFDLNIPIPIPPPAGPSFLNIPMTTYGAASYDILTDYLYRYLDAMKHEVVDSLSAYSYATSGGYAMDSYGMRGEYQFTEKPAFEAIEKMPDIFGIVPVADILESAVGMLGLDSYTINNWDLNEDGIFQSEGRGKHSFNAAEARELDTGAFFSTAAFMSQFQLNKLEYSYWTSTVQNEEMANMDALRLVSMTGKEMMKILNKAIFTIAGRLEVDGPWAVTTLAILNFMLQGFQQSVNEAVMWDILLHDQNENGFVTTMKITNSSLDSEGYDFIEDERKLFAYDYEQTSKAGLMNKAVSGGFGSFELPNQVLNGVANTRRYKPYVAGVDARAGRQGYGAAYAADGNRAHFISRHEGDNNRYDDNWDIRQGFWRDSGMGDINEVYVRTNTVSYTTQVVDGLSDMTPTVTTAIDRYVGSHNRIIGRGYDGAAPLDLESFRTGYFADRYFGEYIGSTDGNNTDDTPGQAQVIGVNGTVDGRAVNVTLHGGQKYYNRIHDYSMMVEAGSTSITLEAQQALAPVFGGNMKLMSVDMNNAAQNFGASTTGEDNPLTTELYKYMRVNESGSNAQLVKEYRDVFNMGLLDDIFLSASAYAPTGGGVTSSVRLKFRKSTEATGAGAQGAGVNLSNLGEYEQRRAEEVVGTTTVVDSQGNTVTQNLLTEPGYLGSRNEYKNVNRGIVDIYLSSFFAFKRQPKTSAK
ncbi:MAG: hypothetical protein ACO1RX_17930 [Candidatus Sericytochromatia bacterium]